MTPEDRDWLACELKKQREEKKAGSLALRAFVAAGVIIGVLVGAAALVDSFLWTESEASTFATANTAGHTVLEKMVAKHEAADGVQNLRLTNVEGSTARTEHNVAQIAERLNVPDIQRAPPPPP